jgi:hypothetical protein
MSKRFKGIKGYAVNVLQVCVDACAEQIIIPRSATSVVDFK